MGDEHWHQAPQTWWDAEGTERPKYALDFWFEWRSQTAFWPENEAAYGRFGIGEIDPDELPLSEATRRQVRELAEWHDKSLNWDYPPDPGPWRQDECDRFNAAVVELYQTVERELGESFTLTNTQPVLREDPDLDAYLQDPKGFRRA